MDVVLVIGNCPVMGTTTARRITVLRLGSIVAVLVTFLLCPVTAFAQEGFSGTIYFRDGDAVAFEHMGNLDGIYETQIYGYLGSQKVTYEFSDLSEIVFSDQKCGYQEMGPGTLVVVSRSGERFTLTDCVVKVKNSGSLYYVYNDPVTKERKATRATIWNNVSHIIIGDRVGGIKINPKTKEYFPAMYVYDPFTGHKLEWATRE